MISDLLYLQLILPSYPRTLTSVISVSCTTGFGEFEGVGVGVSNPGYIVMNDEIISYTGVTNGNLTGITRGVDSTNIVNHANQYRL